MYNEYQPKSLLRAFALFKYRGTQTVLAFKLLLTLRVGDCQMLTKLDVMDITTYFCFKLFIFVAESKLYTYLYIYIYIYIYFTWVPQVPRPADP